MEACVITPQSLNQIKSICAELCDTYNEEVYGEDKDPVLALFDFKQAMNNQLFGLWHGDKQYDLNSINSIVNTIILLLDSNNIINIDPSYFNIDNITRLISKINRGINPSNEPVSIPTLSDSEIVQIRSEANRKFLDDSYGTVYEVQNYMELQASTNLFDCLFINRGSVDGVRIGIVRNTTELNENIYKYLEILFQKIIKFFKYLASKNPDSKLSEKILQLDGLKLYEKIDGKTICVFDRFKSFFDSYLSPEVAATDNSLRYSYNMMNSNYVSLDEKTINKLRIEAYNANVLLKHFDSYLNVLLGDAIQIKDFNRKTGDKLKYQISGKTAKLTTNWRTSENIDIEKEADKVTKLAIKTTPLYKNLSEEPMSGKFLLFSDFEHIIGKVKDLAYSMDAIGIIFDESITTRSDFWNNLSNDTKAILEEEIESAELNNRQLRLSTLINKIRLNPKEYLSVVFEILSNKWFQDTYQTTLFSKNNFNQDELDRLYSLARGIFNLNVEGSLNNLVQLSLSSTTDIDYYSYITQTADSIFNVKFLQYYEDETGIVRIRTLIGQAINNILRQVELTINTVNSKNLIKNWDEYKNLLNIKSEGKEKNYSDLSIRYNIPDTDILVKVDASSGNVKFYSISDGTLIKNFNDLWDIPEIRSYLDKILKLGITDNPILENALISEFGNKADLCKSLLDFAGRVTLNLYVSNEIVKNAKRKDDVREKVIAIYGTNFKYNSALNEINLVHNSDVSTLKSIASAKANLSGLTISSLVKDGFGNGQSNQTQSRLLGSILSQIELQERLPSSATKDCLIISVPGLFEGLYTTKEFHSIDENKESIKFCTSEMAYASIVNDFIGGLMPVESTYRENIIGDGHVLFLPSVNSDKGTIGRIKINLNKTYTINGVEKRIRDLNSQELEYLICDKIGTIYKNLFETIYKDWQVLNNFIQNEIGVNLNLLNGFHNNFKDFNDWFNINKAKSDEAKFGIGPFAEGPSGFIKYWTLEYNKKHRLHPLTLIDLVHYQADKKGNLSFNQTILSQIYRFLPDVLSNYGFDPTGYGFLSVSDFFLLKKFEILEDLIECNFRINTNSSQRELIEIKTKYPAWVNQSGDVILGKFTYTDKEGNLQVKDISSKKDILLLGKEFGYYEFSDIIKLIKTKGTGSFQLNPFIELYNYLEYLFTLEFMCSSVGSFVAHPDKSGAIDPIEEEAGRFLAQHKRNVSFTAAMHAFLLNLLKGIPEEYNIAVIEDIKDKLGIILGQDNDIKPFDGATFVNPFVVLLENYSLGGASAGITKKLFVHFKDHRTGTGGIIKTAGFGLTNDIIRNSKFYQRMMRKMTDHVWLNEDGSEINSKKLDIDLGYSYNGLKIEYKPIYFKLGNRYFLVEDFSRVPDKRNTYKRTINEVEKDGTFKKRLSSEELEKLGIKEESEIKTNYQLWDFFGGKDSMKMDENGKFLEFSNTSVENVVIAMNNMGVRREQGVIKTLKQLWQPLKQVDVHYVATAGAVKQGGANINSVSKYTNEEAYDTQRIKMYLAGIQLDKEHHADDAELSLMTQVISACAAKGYTIDLAISLYGALRTSTELGIKDHLDAVKKLFTDGSLESISNFLNIMLKSVINALGSNSKSDSFAAIITNDLYKKAKEGKEINFSELMVPLSDNTIYAKIFSTITSFLSRAGIRQKVSGLLSVLTPSHEILKLYADRKLESFDNFDSEIAKLQESVLPVYISTPRIEVNGTTIDLSSAPVIYGHPGIGKSYSLEHGFADKFIDFDIEYNHLRDKWIEEHSHTVKGTQAFRNARNEYLVNPESHSDYIWFLTQQWNRIKEKAKLEGKTLMASPSILLKLFPQDFNYILNLDSNDFIIRNINRGASSNGSNLWKLAIDETIKAVEPYNIPIVTLNEGLYLSDILKFDSISNIDLGRNYIITYKETTPEGEVIENPVSKNIITPTDYFNLKQEIKDGKVIRVIENLKEGRNLASYNVRFKDVNGQSYLLWDLTSAQNLYKFNEFKKEIKSLLSKYRDAISDEDKLNIGNTIWKKLFDFNSKYGDINFEPNVTVSEFLNRTETKIRRLLLRDLMNLSNTTPDLINDYDELLSSKPNENSEEWYLKFAQWVNILLGLANGSYLILDGSEKPVLPNLVITINGSDTAKYVEKHEDTIDTLSHPGENGMHFGNPFSTTGENGTIQMRTIKETVDAYDKWLRGIAYLNVEPLRRQWILDLIESGALKGKKLVYDSKLIPGKTYDGINLADQYDKVKRPNHAHILLNLINETQGLYIVNENNFDTVKELVRKILSNAAKVNINIDEDTKELVSVDKNSIKTQAYELVVPKQFMTAFGLELNLDLNSIIGDKDFFVKLFLMNLATKGDISDPNYTIELKVSNGNHYYLLQKGSSTEGLIKDESILVSTENGKTFRLDANNEIMYEITPDTEIYRAANGTEVIVSNDLDFYINNLNYDSVKLSPNLRNHQSKIKDIIKTLSNSSNKIAKNFVKDVTAYGDKPSLIMDLNDALYNINTLNYLSYISENPETGERTTTSRIIKRCWEKHTSLLRSLDIVAARIPAQSMLSFMAMKVVAYDNPDINTAYVSTLQLLLLGSDYDIDAVSLATYDVDSNGIIKLWSPYANILTEELMEESLKLPFPSGEKTNFEEVDSIEPLAAFLNKYKDLFIINKAQYFNKSRKTYLPSQSEISLDFDTNSVEKLKLMKEFLNDIKKLQVPEKVLYSDLSKRLEENNIAEGLTVDHISSLIEELKGVADRHNLYFDNKSKGFIELAVSNHRMYSMYSIISDPANLIEAQTPVDSTTGPIKDIAEESKEAGKTRTRTPGNFVNKFESIVENMVGKEAIGICANSLKSFFALTQYANYLLNYGTAELQQNIILGKEGKGLYFSSLKDPSNPNKKTVYKVLANIRAKNPSTVTNQDVLEALSLVTNDRDAALTLSALLSLSTDNAKELTLSKLNASPKMLGMYLFGISIGMDFRDVSKILMSDAGATMYNLLNSNVFTGDEGFNSPKSVFEYFMRGPWRLLKQFDVHSDSSGKYTWQSPLSKFELNFKKYIHEKLGGKADKFKLSEALIEFSKTNKWTLNEKLLLLENQRKYYNGHGELKQIYNLLIDFVLSYVIQCHTMFQNESIFYDMKRLAEGAEEMRTLGSILSLNVGLKALSSEAFKQVSNFENAIYDITGKEEDVINIHEFIHDPEKRLEYIKRYDLVKTAFNILDVVATVPHFMGYLQTLEVAVKEEEESFKFRSIRKSYRGIKSKFKLYDDEKLVKGLQNYLGDKILQDWMLLRLTEPIIIPAGNKVFDSKGLLKTLISDFPLMLGSESANSTFKMWMETEVIPNLKAGRISPTIIDEKTIKENPFIKDLGNEVSTAIILRNPSVVYSLPINMLPRINNEKYVLNTYKDAFDKLGSETYTIEYHTYDSLGKPIVESKSYAITDLITYYAMIANNWKLNEKSLVPILGSLKYLNNGKLREFLDYLAALDMSGITLDLNEVPTKELAPYISESDNRYTSNKPYLIGNNRDTSRREVYTTNPNYGEEEDDDIPESGVKQEKYISLSTGLDTNYFPLGYILRPDKNIVLGLDEEISTEMTLPNGRIINISYNKNTGDISELTTVVNGETVKLKEIKVIPHQTLDGRPVIKLLDLEDFIENELNPC